MELKHERPIQKITISTCGYPFDINCRFVGVNKLMQMPQKIEKHRIYAVTKFSLIFKHFSLFVKTLAKKIFNHQ